MNHFSNQPKEEEVNPPSPFEVGDLVTIADGGQTGQVMELFDDKTCIINTTTGAFGIPLEFLMPCSNSNANNKNVGVQRFTKSLRAIIDSGADSILISNPEAIIPITL